MHPLIKSTVFHYEFKFIHPFADGNGCMGRMWHSLLLGKWNELFYWLPIEEFIRTGSRNIMTHSENLIKRLIAAFLWNLLLEIILDTLKETAVVGKANVSAGAELPVPVRKIMDALGDEELSAAEIMKRLGLSHRPNFQRNYLNPVLKYNLIEMIISDKRIAGIKSIGKK